MATEEELQKATTFLSMAEVPPSMKGKISKVINGDGSMTITNIATGHQTIITKENVATALKGRGV